MKQKLLFLLAALAFLLPARLSAFNYKYEGVTLRYEVIDEEAKTCKVSGYKDFSGALVIPDVANDGTTDYCVTEIGEKVFENFSDMTSVVIGNSVQTIGDRAFYYCKGLTSVEIGNSVQTIGEKAFNGCSGLTSVVIGNSVTSIGSYAFSGCSGLIKSAYPNTLKNPFDKGTTVAYNPEGAIIEGGFVFGPNKSVIYFAPPSLEGEYSIPESVTSIGSEAFSGCRSLTSVVIPKSVTEIGYFAFFSCYGLKKAEFSSVESLCNIKFSSSAANPLEYAHNLYIDGVEVTEIVIPEPITSISDRTFNGCSGLTSVVIGNSVQTIGESAFRGCSSLTSLVIGNSVETIGSSAFQYCKGLTSVEIPNSVQTIGDEAFRNCSRLTSVEISNSVESIGGYAFEGCSGLTSVVIGNSVQTIGEKAFYGCSSLTSVMIPNSVTKIGASAFTGCSSLISLIFNAENCKSAGSSTYPVFPDSLETVVFGDKVTTIPNYLFYYKTKLTSVVISNSVTSIGNYTFKGCSGLTSVVIGNSVQTIGECAFEGCSGLTSVVIPNSVHTIGDYAFYGCNLDKIIMGCGIKTIERSAFEECQASEIYITAQTPPEIESSTFDNYKGILYLQGQAAVNAYDDDKYWGNFNNELMTVPTALEIEGLTSISGNAGDTFQLKAKMTPEDVTLPYILWRSTNPKIATVDNNGLMELQEYSAEDLTRAEGDEDNDGTCKIIAESLYFDGPIAEIVVNNTGVAAASIALDESNLDLKVGQSAKLTATVKNVEDETVTWTSSNEAVATVDAEGNVTAVAVGEADITATCGSVSASCKVTVTPIIAESITLSQESWSAHAGETVKLTATVLPEDTTDKTVTWTSSNDAVATVDAEGNVTAVAVGEADITATCGSVSASCKVTVLPILVESLTIDPTAWSGEEGSEFTIKAAVLPENAENKTLTFESSDTAVATVDAEGNVKVLKEGTCVITVSTVDGSDLKAECVVTGLSGVDAIFADPSVQVDVYDMNGVMLRKGCSREELKQLKPAVYILRSGEAVVKAIVK